MYLAPTTVLTKNGVVKAGSSELRQSPRPEARDPLVQKSLSSSDLKHKPPTYQKPVVGANWLGRMPAHLSRATETNSNAGT